MRRSVYKIWMKTVRIIVVQHQMLHMDIVFRGDENPAFISIGDIQNVYVPMGFSNFKIEGRGLGSAIVLESLYYMTKPEYQLHQFIRQK